MDSPNNFGLNHLDMKQEAKLLAESNPSGHIADDY